MNENDMNLVTAIDFIDQTKVEEPVNQKPEPTEITIEEKRSKRAKILLGIGIVVLSAAIVAILIYVVWRFTIYVFNAINNQIIDIC